MKRSFSSSYSPPWLPLKCVHELHSTDFLRCTHCTICLLCLYPRFHLSYSANKEEPNGQKPETTEETNRARAREGRGTEVHVVSPLSACLYLIHVLFCFSANLINKKNASYLMHYSSCTYMIDTLLSLCKPEETVLQFQFWIFPNDLRTSSRYFFLF